jgi:SAM-dependent methyltransferase
VNCPLCQESNLSLIYEVRDIPVFQNKVYESVEAARNAQTANVSLVLCKSCSFVFNSSFDMNIMNYDAQYQNEQAYSCYFQNYLDGILNLLASEGFRTKRITEIGCGKGYFLEKLQKHNFEVTGFDPAYEGNNPKIIKDYFTGKYSHLNADLFILRHNIEHIQNPLDFLHTVAATADYKGMIFIEVPTFEWIIKKKAFWDIFYEHCNYFTFDSLGSIFRKSKQGTLFNDQYMYLLADLKDLRTQAKPAKPRMNYRKLGFQDSLNEYREFVENHTGMLIWGAGAKGSTFVNLIDGARKYVSYVVDINPKKQNRYIAKTAHKIISPRFLVELEGRDILVMNDNYYEETKKDVGELDFNLYVLGTS